MRRLVLLVLLAGCAAPSSSGPSASPPGIDGVDRRVSREVNVARERARRKPLAWRDDLASLARAHSRDMAARNFFDHVSPDGRSPNDRATAAGIPCRVPLRGRMRVGVSENLYVTTRYRRYVDRTSGGRVTRIYDWYSRAGLADRTVRGWLGSPGHRRNMLDADARAHGIGVAADRNNRLYVTQVLC